MSDIDNNLGFQSSPCLRQSRPSGSKDPEVSKVSTATAAVLSLKESWMMVVTILVITLPDRGGLRSFTPLLNLQLAIVRQFKETKLERDP